MTDMNEIEKNVLATNISDIMEKKYLDYGMSVIVDRALPDIRDGLKPVHRRIIFAMHKLGNYHNKPYKKSARIVGDVIGKYHPHGDSSVYDAMVRMAQEFSMRAPLVDGQGNFGSIDGDSAAAMRYTESRLSKLSEIMLDDIEKDTIDYHDNYDATEKIPTVLPTTYPNLLVNGTQGIAVGMAANIPTHNPIEVLNCILMAISKGGVVLEEDLAEYMTLMPAPDFPTGGIVHDLKEMPEVWKNGRGKVQLRARWEEETVDSGRQAIVINEIPYQVNKTKLLEKIGELVNKNQDGVVQVEGVADFNDESDKDGLRIVIELKRDADPHVVFNHLAKGSQLNTSINYNNTVLVNNRPKLVGIIEVLNEFIKHRVEVITRRTKYLDKKAAARQHLLEGLIKALDPEKVEKVIEMIRFSKTNAEASEKLMEYLTIDEIQAEAILDIKLQKLTSDQMNNLIEENQKLLVTRQGYADILNSRERLFEVMKKETEETIEVFEKKRNAAGKRVYGVRLSETVYDPIMLDMASLVKEEECTIILTADGFARRIPLEEMEQQNRGTRGKSRMNLREKDFIIQSLNSHSHNKLMGITKSGKCFVLEAYEITDSMKGKYINTIADIDNEEDVIMLLPVDFTSNQDLVLVTKTGKIMRSGIENYMSAKRKGGIKAITLDEGNEVIHATLSSEDDDMVMVNTANKIIRFKMDQIRKVSRGSKGVTGMRVKNGDGDIIGGDVVSQENVLSSYIVTVSEKGMVKITEMDQYKLQKHGGMGVLAMKATGKVGGVFKAMIVQDLSGELITTTKAGVSNRISLKEVTVTSRTTRGVRLIKMDEKDELADVFYYKDEVTEEDLEMESGVDVDNQEVEKSSVGNTEEE